MLFWFHCEPSYEEQQCFRTCPYNLGHRRCRIYREPHHLGAVATGVQVSGFRGRAVIDDSVKAVAVAWIFWYRIHASHAPIVDRHLALDSDRHDLISTSLNSGAMTWRSYRSHFIRQQIAEDLLSVFSVSATCTARSQAPV